LKILRKLAIFCNFEKIFSTPLGIELHLSPVKKSRNRSLAVISFIGMAVVGLWVDTKLDELSDLDIYLILDDNYN
jgi:hypothetical protein